MNISIAVGIDTSSQRKITYARAVGFPHIRGLHYMPMSFYRKHT